jgi:tetratricopeptide (TPR) repeat protein/TolB-like protein
LHDFAHDNPQPVAQVIDLIIQVSEGLAAAHAKGVVHRDIKASNVVVDDNGHPRILDFGLATVAGDQKLTKTGSTLGTVAYMSPEQIKGEKMDHRSDLWSLGVVLYELIAGRTPFRRESEAATMQAILNEQPEPLARYRSGVPDGVQYVVDKLLDKDPKTRYQSAAGVQADLLREKRLIDSGVSSPSRPVSTIAKPSGLSRKLLLSSGGLVVLIVLALVLKPWKIEVRPTDEASASGQRLAVMYFDNLADPDDSARLGEIVTNLLITDLAEVHELGVLSSQRLYDILTDLGKEGSHTTDRETASKVAERARATLMLTGTILQTQPRYVITAQVVNVGSGEVATSQQATASPGEDIFSLVGRLSSSIKQGMSLSVGESAGSGQSLATMTTSSPEAYRCYLEGIELLYKLYQLEGREKLERAVELDSTFAMAHYQLAMHRFGGDAAAHEHIEAAIRHIDKVTPMQRRQILAGAAMVADRFDEALAQYKQILADYPQDLEAYYLIAEILGPRLARFEEAIPYRLKIIELDPQEPSNYNDVAYDYKRMRNIEKALEWADKYVEMAPDQPNPYDSKGEMLAFAGRMDEAIKQYERALEVDPNFFLAYGNLASVYLFAGDYEGVDRCINALIRSPSPIMRARAREGMAVKAYSQGRMREAVRSFTDGIAADRLDGTPLSETLGKYVWRSYAYRSLGNYDSALVDLATARDSSMSIYSNKRLHFRNLYAEFLAQSGHPTEALELVRSLRNIPSTDRTAWARLLYISTGNIFTETGQLDSAEAYFERAMMLSGDVPPKWRLWYARVLLADGRLDDAIEQLTIVTTTMEEVGWVPVARAHYYLALAYEKRGDEDKAIQHLNVFLDRWENADPDLPELVDGKRRLARLKQAS